MRHFALVAAALAAVAAAQSTRIVPPSAAAGERNEVSWQPFTYEFGRTQQLWNGDAICQNSAVITGLAMRRDGPYPRAFQARSLPMLQVTLGHTAQTAATMSTVFAGNRTGAQTTIYSGPYQLPPLPPPTGLPAWNVVFTASQPFVYQRSLGNLLSEWVLPGVAQVKYEYGLDADVTRASGTTRVLGAFGTFAGGDQPAFQLSSPTAQLVPGGTLALAATNFRRVYPSLIWLGTSATAWGTVPLPFDLGVLGAPGNHLRTGLEAVTALVLMPQGTTYGGTLTLPLANDPTLGGQTLYSQMLSIDPASNTLGMVFANGVELQIGGGFVYTQMIVQSDDVDPNGTYPWPNATGGAAVQLHGSFQ